MNKANIEEALEESGISTGEILMIHGDSAVCTQLTEIEAANKFKMFISYIIDYLGPKGTLVVPTFSYSFTKNETFDVDNTKSTIGKFSEYFRTFPGVERSSHPIFSIAVIGKNKDMFMDTTIKDCFGEGSSFDLLYKLDGKLMNLGCNFNLTFAHYVEQKAKVNYRYYKNFEGIVISNSKKIYTKTRYFVGKKKIKYSLNLDCLKRKLVEKNKIRIVPFGRFASYTVSARDFFYFANDIIKKNQYGIIIEGIDG